MKRSLSYQVGILTLSRTLAYGVMFFVPIVNVRALSVHDYGVYRQFWLLFETISAVFIMSFPNSLFYYLPRSDSRREKSVYVIQTVVFLAAMGVLSWSVYLVMEATLGAGLGGVVRRFLWRLCLFTLFMMVSRYMDNLFVAERQVERQSIYHFISNTAQAVMVMLVSWYTRSVDDLIWALSLFALAKFVFTLAYTQAVYRPSLADISMSSIREQLSYALPLGMASISLLLLSQTDKYVITHYLGSAGFAVYSVGAFQLPVVNIVRGSVTNITFPLMARYQKEGRYHDIVELWQRATLKTAVIFYPLFIFLELCARPFIEILFTRKYSAAVPVFAIYLLLFFRSTVETGSVIMVFKKTGFLFKVYLVGFLANVTLSIIFFEEFGRLGVPAATVLVIYCTNLANIMRASRLLQVSFLHILPWRKLGSLVLISLAPGLLLYFFDRFSPVDTLAELAAAGVAYMGIYGLIAYRLGFVGWGDIKSILGRGEGGI